MKKYIYLIGFGRYDTTMKWARNVLGILLLAYVSLLPAHIVSAKSFSVHGGSITIQSKILETHYIIIDERSEITEITSNTADAATPRVFFQRVALGNERPLTEDVYQQYRTILPGSKANVGTVYKRSELARLPLFSNVAKSNDLNPLAFIKR